MRQSNQTAEDSRQIAEELLQAFNKAISDGKVENLGLDVRGRTESVDSSKVRTRYNTGDTFLPRDLFTPEDVEAGRAPADAVILEERAHPGIRVALDVGNFAMASLVSADIAEAMKAAGFKQDTMPHGSWQDYTLQKNYQHYVNTPHDRGPYADPYGDNSFSLSAYCDSDHSYGTSDSKTFTLRFASDEGVKLFQRKFNDIMGALDNGPNIAAAAI